MQNRKQFHAYQSRNTKYNRRLHNTVTSIITNFVAYSLYSINKYLRTYIYSSIYVHIHFKRIKKHTKKYTYIYIYVSITLLYYFVKYTYNLFSSRYLHKGHD